MLQRLSCLALSLAVALAGLVLVAAASPASADTVSLRVRAAVRHLPVAYQHPAGFARSKFRYWVDANRDCQNTRDEVLRAESRTRTTGRCTPSTGRWLSYYDGRVLRDSSSVVVDHLVPIAEAWRSGARRWNAATRRAYANDLSPRSLVGVSFRARRTKGDRDPAQWLPRYGKCQYVRQWVAVKLRWRLSVNPAERATLLRWANRCPNPVLNVHRARVVLQKAVSTTTTTTSGATDLYVYGHSWTTGYGLADPSVRYTRQVAEALGLRFSDDVSHSRGVNGAKAHQVLARLYGGTSASAARWDTGTDGVVLLQVLLNSLRDQGADPDAVETSRQAMRTMLATLNAAQRIEQDDPRVRLSGAWSTSAANPTASGGTWARTTRSGDFAQWAATGGEYVALRGMAGAGATARLTDRVTGAVLRRVDTSDHIDPVYGGSIGYVFRVPASAAGHAVRLTSTGGGVLGLDVILPARRDRQKVILVKEPYVDWSASPTYTLGSDHVCDVFNALVDQVATEFGNVVVVDPNASGLWHRDTDLQTSGVGPGTHPNELGSTHLRQAVTAVVPSI